MAEATPEGQRDGEDPAEAVDDDDHLPHVAAVSEALEDWPPCWAVVDEGQHRDSFYVSVLLDPIPGEYYPFVGVSERLDQTGVDAEILGFEADPDTEFTALILRVVDWTGA